MIPRREPAHLQAPASIDTESTSSNAMKTRQVTIEQAFGRVLQVRRKQLGLSQEELGFRSGLHRTFVSQIERGVKSPSLRTLQTLASALDTQAAALVQEAEQIARRGTQ